MFVETNLCVTPTKIEDILSLKDNLRKDDIKEITILNSNPLHSLLEGFFLSDECYSVFVGEHIVGIFGFNKKYHNIWFLGNSLSETYKRIWIKPASYYIKHFLEISPVLTNIISVENKLHIKWLERMGAKFSAPYKINNHYFQDFYIIKR